MQSETKVSFGALLRRYRAAAAGISQELLAERAGLSRRGIADLEGGARRYPYGDTIRRLAAALELGPAERAALLAAGHRQSPETYRHTFYRSTFRRLLDVSARSVKSSCCLGAADW